ncbi:thermonuclease family protein [Planctomycetota bacterium]
MRLTAPVLFLLPLSHALAAAPEAPLPKSLTGKVVSIADGDTVTILVDKTQHRIRFDSIDCPERGQAFGTRAREFTSRQVFQKLVTVRVTDKDRYGRYVGRVIYEGKDDKGKPVSLDLSVELVRNGLAWWYRKYAPKDKQLAKLEEEAREAKLGLWADPKPVPPWEWRSRKREASQPKEGTGSHWLNMSSNVRHNSSCEWFRKTKRGRFCGPEEGKPCGICGG